MNTRVNTIGRSLPVVGFIAPIIPEELTLDSLGSTHSPRQIIPYKSCNFFLSSASATEGADSGTRWSVQEGLGVLSYNAVLVGRRTAFAAVLLKVLFVILDDLGGDLILQTVLLTGSLGCGCGRSE